MNHGYRLLIVVLIVCLSIGLSATPVGASEATASSPADLSDDSDAIISPTNCEVVQSIDIECGGGGGSGGDDGGGGGVGPAPYP